VASIASSGAAMKIHQGSERAAINWQSFNIGKDASVTVAQPSSSSVLLNRIGGDAPSQIFGRLSANGQIVLVNPSGITFGKDGSVSAAGLTASTLGISDADFMAGNMKFSRNGASGAIVNQGQLRSTPGGYVALLGAKVSNEGLIFTPQGSAYLAGAEAVKMPVTGSGRIKLELSPSAIAAAVANSGTIVAQGGQVFIQASAAASAMASVLHSGSIDTSGDQAGKVTLLADGGDIRVSGSITANSTGKNDQGQTRAGGDIVIGRDEATGVLAATSDVSGARLESKGGFIETSGHHLTADGLGVQAATWLIDPVDIEINSSGTRTQTAYSQISNQTINTALNAGTSVTVTTAGSGSSSAGGLTAGTSTVGNILVSGAIAKTAGGNATLSLTADKDIIINNSITSSSGALGLNLTATAGAIGGTGAITLNTGSLNISNATASVYDGVITTHNNNAWTTSVTTKSGAGSLKIRGKSLLGTLNVNQGTFTISNETWADQTAPTTASVVNIASGATLDYFTAAGTNLDLFPVTPYGSIGSTSYNGAGTLSKSGAGNLYWGSGSAQFNFSSGSLINIQAGYFAASSSANEVWTNNRSSLNVASGANFYTVEGAIRVDGLTGAGAVMVGYATSFPNSSLTIGVANNALGTSTFSGTIYDNGSYIGRIIKEGSGTQILSGTNYYTGTTTVNGGTLQIGNGGASGTLGNGGAVSVASGANLSFYRNDGPTVSNAISGAGTVNFLGTGTTGQSQYALTGNNSGLTGRINISSSRLAVRAANQVGTAAITVNSGAQIYADGSASTFTLSNALSLAGMGWSEGYGVLGALRLQNVTYAGPITLAANARITGLFSTNTISGAISGTGGVEFGADTGLTGGALILTGANTYAGSTTINTASSLQLGNGGTTGSIDNTSSIVDNGSLIVNRSNPVTIAAGISGTGTLTQSGTGTTTLTGTNAYSGTTSVNAGLLQLGNGGSSGTLGTGAVSVATGAKLGFNRSDAGLVVSSAISGAGAVQQTGTGTTALTGTNTYSGATTISAGTLQVGNAGSTGTLGTGAVSVASGSTLGFNRSDTAQVVNNTISGAGTVWQYGTGKTTLTGANTYTGITKITKGTLVVGNGTSGTIGTSAIQIDGASTTLQFVNPGSTLVNLTSAQTVTGNGTIIADKAIAFGGTVSINKSAADGNSNLTLKTTAVDNTLAGAGNGINLNSTVQQAGTDNVSLTIDSFSSVNTNTTGSIGLSGASYGKLDVNMTARGNVASGQTVNSYGLSLSKMINANGGTATLADQTKTYDGTTSATLASGAITATGVTVNGVAETASVTQTSGTYNNKNVVGASSVTASLASSDFTAASGVDLGNYNLPTSVTGTGAITAKTVSYAGLAVSNKTYDQSTNATLSGTAALGTVAAGSSLSADSKVIASDTVSLSGTAVGTYASKNVAATNNTVTFSGLSLAGADASNYTLVQQTSLNGTGTITAKTLTPTVSASDKTYDGNSDATVSALGSSGVYSGDTVSFSHTGASFADRHVAKDGSGNVLAKTVTASGIAMAGADASNYALASTSATTTASITPKALTLAAVTDSKTYDGTTSSGGTVTAAALVTGDSVTASQSFASKDVLGAGGSTLQVNSGYTVNDGNSGNNYTVSTTTASGTITQANLTVTANADAKFVTQADATGYSGVSYSGLVNGETSAVLGGSLNITRTNASTNVGAGTYAGTLVASGLTSGNYNISYATGDYTIVPANQLLIRTTDVSTTYGTAPTYSSTAQYLDGSNVIHTLSQSSTGNSLTFSDGAGGSVATVLRPYTVSSGSTTAAGVSSSGNTVVGSYSILDTTPTITGSNFLGSPVYVGTLTVTPKALTA
jgi:filamentous hemagglutinin family protein